MLENLHQDAFDNMISFLSDDNSFPLNIYTTSKTLQSMVEPSRLRMVRKTLILEFGGNNLSSVYYLMPLDQPVPTNIHYPLRHLPNNWREWINFFVSSEGKMIMLHPSLQIRWYILGEVTGWTNGDRIDEITFEDMFNVRLENGCVRFDALALERANGIK